MDISLETDLKECLKLINGKWKMQNDVLDKQTNFIYKMKSLKECLEEIKKRNVDEEYALHRWYNYMTSKYCEQIFCDYGAKPEKNIYDHDIDIYVNSIPFDVKLTVYPSKLEDKPYDLTTRMGKNEMIDWFYNNQSQESRKQLINRLYVVCDGNSPEENLRMKSDFEILREKISKFMQYVSAHGLNEVIIEDNDTDIRLNSDLIYIKY